jgi:hypothetical protein
MSDKRMRPFVKEKPGAEWLEQARAMGEQLLQAKAELAELRAEIRIKDAALEAKGRVHQSELEAKDAALQAKDRVHKAEAALLEFKLQGKDALLEAKEALIRRLRRRCSTGPWRSSAPCACCHPTRFFRRGARSVRRSERRPPCVYQGPNNCVMSSGVGLRCRVRAQPRLHLHTLGLNRLYVRACKNV